MKKLLLMSVIALILGATSAYAKCEGGIEIKGVINGHTYCQSTTNMTWWAALSWCEFQGRELASMEQMCPSWGAAVGAGACPNMKIYEDGWDYAWSVNPYSESNSFYIHMSSGNVGGHVFMRSAANSAHAVCY